MFNFKKQNKKTYLQQNVDFDKAYYEGFVLKRYFWFGKIDGVPIATSGRVCQDGKFPIFLKDENWKFAKRLTPNEMKQIFANFKEQSSEEVL